MAYASEAPQRGAGRTEPFDAGGTRALGASGTWAVVLHEHGMIRALLENVRRAMTAAVRSGEHGLPRLRRAVWALYTTFVRHQEMEEAKVAPVLRAFDAWGDTRATAMILEHNEQRRLLVALVEECEREVKTPSEIVAQTGALVDAITEDMATEERLLTPIFEDTIVALDQEDG